VLLLELARYRSRTMLARRGSSAKQSQRDDQSDDMALWSSTHEVPTFIMNSFPIFAGNNRVRVCGQSRTGTPFSAQASFVVVMADFIAANVELDSWDQGLSAVGLLLNAALARLGMEHGLLKIGSRARPLSCAVACDALRDAGAGESARAIVDFDLDELASIEPPRGGMSQSHGAVAGASSREPNVVFRAS
jgi:hypothetical protein